MANKPRAQRILAGALVFWGPGMFDDLLEAVDATMAHRKDRVAIEDVDFGYSYGTSIPG